MRIVLAGVAILVISGSAVAQTRPFPQNVTYAAGYEPASLTPQNALAAYDLVKSSNLKNDCGSGYLRLEFKSPVGTTVSEGMGYGMLLAAYHGDQATFDGLWKFVQKNWTLHQLMGWKVTCSGFDMSSGTYGDAPATDGELDIAFGLVVAGEQWGEPYRQAGIDYVGRIKKYLFQQCPETGRWVQRPGEFGGCGASNTSYWMPGYYRVFAEITGDTFWNDVIRDTYAIISLNQNATTGFLSNETDQYGNVPAGQGEVNYNGCRTPWRIAADYVWFGTPEAKAYLDKLVAWGEAQGPAKLLDGFTVDGQMTGTWNQSAPFAGGWACGAMAHSQTSVDAFTVHFKTCTLDGYYHDELRALYDLMLTGNFWKPGAAVAPIDGGAPVLGEGGTGGSVITKDGGSGGAWGGGTGGASAAGGGPDAAAGAQDETPGGDSACGCTVPGGRHVYGFAATVLAALWLRARRSRRA